MDDVSHETKNPVGRPPIWTDPLAFNQRVDEYFNDKDILHTWSGLALYLGFVSRDSLWDYSKKPEFSDSVKKALSKIESIYEQRMNKSNNPSGAIFALKNFGWKDRQEIKHEGTAIGFLSIDPLDDQTNDSPSQDSEPKKT